MSGYVERARAVAIAVHAGQVDKAGAPYVLHPGRVALAVEWAGGGPELVAAAWLHDVVEDSAVTFVDLHDMGFTSQTIWTVDALTRGPTESHEEAVLRASSWPGSRLVKLCDVRDNADPARLALLDDETRTRLEAKYARAEEILDV